MINIYLCDGKIMIMIIMINGKMFCIVSNVQKLYCKDTYIEIKEKIEKNLHQVNKTSDMINNQYNMLDNIFQLQYWTWILEIIIVTFQTCVYIITTAIICDIVNMYTGGGAFIWSDDKPSNKYYHMIRYMPISCIWCDNHVEKLYKRTFLGIMGYTGSCQCKRCELNGPCG
jgi:hypothetical protein